MAILRLLLAILLRASQHGQGRPPSTWSVWWRSGLPLAEVDDYLDVWSHRFDLRHPSSPFMQVADLTTATGRASGLTKLIAELPDGHAFFTQRAGSGRASLGAAEAARWLVHCQSFDPSGIKTGALGDDRVSGGRGYPIGVAWTGRLGVVVAEGANLAETLLLNLQPYQGGAVTDLPSWERVPLSAAPDVDYHPTGPAGLYTWQSRRVRLIWTQDHVVDVQISNGDRLDPPNLMIEPMTAWRRNPNQEKQLGLPTVYMPRQHDPARQMWRGLAGLIDDKPERNRDDGSTLRPGVVRWIATLQDQNVLPMDRLIRLRTVGVAYGSNNSVIDAMVDDELDAHVAMIATGQGVTLALRGVSCADNGVQALAELGANLADATNSDRDAGRQKAREQGYSALDPHFREWFQGLNSETDPDVALGTWSMRIMREITAEGESLIKAAGPNALKGRNTGRPGEKPRHMDLGKAWMFFRMKLHAELTLPDP
ncbi:MAG: type I-E CRISPR-associated protein Cse1/CasA [Micropruina sp.]|nr:type I-E CRISPR-associated protein Cse1/CasA [Micropruina sp.]